MSATRELRVIKPWYPGPMVGSKQIPLICDLSVSSFVPCAMRGVIVSPLWSVKVQVKVIFLQIVEIRATLKFLQTLFSKKKLGITLCSRNAIRVPSLSCFHACSTAHM